MAKNLRVKATLKDAGNVKSVWQTNPDLKMDNMGFNDFVAFYEATDGLYKEQLQPAVKGSDPAFW